MAKVQHRTGQPGRGQWQDKPDGLMSPASMVINTRTRGCASETEKGTRTGLGNGELSLESIMRKAQMSIETPKE